MSEPQSTCGVCGQTDDHPKHQIAVGDPARRLFHEHDFTKTGTIHYHFDCPSEWHDLHTNLATEPFESPDPAAPWMAWEAPSAALHRAVADVNKAIIDACTGGLHGDELRQWIANLNARGGAGGVDVAIANATLDAWAPNSGTATVGVKTMTGPISMRIMTANGSDSAAGTEQTTSAGYTVGGQAMAFAAATSGSKATNASVSWTNFPSCTSTGMEEWDASATKQRVLWTPWSGGNIVIAAGNTFTVASAGVTNSLA